MKHREIQSPALFSGEWLRMQMDIEDAKSEYTETIRARERSLGTDESPMPLWWVHALDEVFARLYTRAFHAGYLSVETEVMQYVKRVMADKKPYYPFFDVSVEDYFYPWIKRQRRPL